MNKFPPLLLRNGEADQNMCSLNSNLQLLRRVPNFISELSAWKDSSDLINALNYIFSHSGTTQPVGRHFQALAPEGLASQCFVGLRRPHETVPVATGSEAPPPLPFGAP